MSRECISYWIRVFFATSVITAILPAVAAVAILGACLHSQIFKG